MEQRSIQIINKLGLHARAAAKFVTLASSFDSDIRVFKGAHRVDGKSMMGVLQLAASKGTDLKIETEGTDESTAITALCELIERRFDEHE